jgi:cell division septation protein DedD
MIQTSAEAPPQQRAIFERRPEPAAERAPEPAAERPAAAKSRQQPPPPVVPDLSAFQLRGSGNAPAAPVTIPAQPAARQPHSRWEKPEPARAQPASASRFAPPRTAPPAMVDEDELDPFAEGGLFADHAEAPEADDDLGLEDLGTLPPYAEDEHLPPLEDDLDALPQRRGISRNVLVIAGVVLVALIGGVSFAMFRGGETSTGTPPVITADGSPTKITPDDATAPSDATTQNKLIYDRVNSGGQGSTDTTLLKPDSGPVQNVGSQDAGNAISRVIIPGGPGFDAPSANGANVGDRVAGASSSADATAPRATDPVGELAANDAQADADPIQPIGPRKVRTVIVKPDGTIVYSNAKDAQPADTAPSTVPAADSATATAQTQAPPAEPTPAVTDDVAAISGSTGDALPITAPSADDSTDAAVPAAPAKDTAAPPAATTTTAKPVATKPVPAKPATEVAIADDGSSPIDLTPDATAAPAAGGVLVQISSQRSEDAARATYRDLQARYPNILGSYQVNIQRADVPDRGTFYRVRVGPFSQNDAQRLCDDLRQAGGDCVLAKR